MIQEKTMYTVICDGFGKDVNEGSEYSCWSEPSLSEDIAVESNWKIHDKKHYCLNCWFYDDDDNLQFKQK